MSNPYRCPPETGPATRTEKIHAKIGESWLAQKWAKLGVVPVGPILFVCGFAVGTIWFCVSMSKAGAEQGLRDAALRDAVKYSVTCADGTEIDARSVNSKGASLRALDDTDRVWYLPAATCKATPIGAGQ